MSDDTHDDDVQQWYDSIDIKGVHALLSDAGAESIWVKRLGVNNNSKQQIYFGTDPSDLSFLPLGMPTYTPAKSKKKGAGAPVIQIPVPWDWVTLDGVYEAPQAKLCYYPQYPEIRFSGFLQRCKKGPSELMSIDKRGKEAGRCLFLGPVKPKGDIPAHVVGLVVGADSPAAQYVAEMPTFRGGRLCALEYSTNEEAGEFGTLEKALQGIVGRKLVTRRLTSDGELIMPYTAPNGAGLTLEAMLGVGENAIPGPDFDIWELKVVKQRALSKRYSHKITLFTPQPDCGWVTEHALTDFVLRYGHVTERDDDGNPVCYYFTMSDIAKTGDAASSARLTMGLEGFTSARRFDANGMIGLRDRQTGSLIAGWSFMKLLDHWQRKHNRAAYVPYVLNKDEDVDVVEFGPLVTLGISTSFGQFLQAFHDDKIVYDPGDKITLKDGKWKPHARSQFRMNLKDIDAIYETVKQVDLRDPETY